MRKKYIGLLVILGILIIITFILFKTTGPQQNLLEETGERTSKDYKITGDSILINLPQEDKLGENINNMQTAQKTLSLISLVFDNQTKIPTKYTCDGDNTNPPFKISGINMEAKSLVLIMDDPNASAGVWNHWIKFNMPVFLEEIKEGEEPEGISGKGTGGSLKYSGPCPPDKEHNYVFRLYSLDKELTLPEGSTRVEIEETMKGHILQTTEWIGKYERIN